MNWEEIHNTDRPSYKGQAGALYRGCVVHDFSIELYRLDVNVRCSPNICLFE
jgi:hypothetical protein